MTANVAKCLLVSKLIVSDGMVTDDERAFLGGLMRQLGLTEEERRRVTALEGLAEAEATVRGLPPAEKRAFIDLLIDAASADGHLSPHEMKLVKKMSSMLGVD